MSVLDCLELTPENISVLKDWEIRFCSIAAPGAMGSPGAVKMADAKNHWCSGNIAFGNAISAEELESLVFHGDADNNPDWHHIYTGYGNHLYVHSSVYDEFFEKLGDKTKPSDIYGVWEDIAWKILSDANMKTKRSGISHSCEIARPASEANLQVIHEQLQFLRDMPYEHLIVTFRYESSDEFIQSYAFNNEGKKLYHVEIGTMCKGEKCLFKKTELSFEEARDIFDKVCTCKGVKLSDWEDIWEKKNKEHPYPDEDEEEIEEEDEEELDSEEEDEEETENENSEEKVFSRHIYPRVKAQPDEKPYLAVGQCTDLNDAPQAESRDDTATFVYAIEPAGEKELDIDEQQILSEILSFAASIYHFLGLNVDGLEIGIANSKDMEMYWKRDEAKEGRYHIGLCAESAHYWNQVIYQLGYEFTHVLLDRQNHGNRVPWIEETICEMMSLRLLTEFANHWDECELSEEDPGYSNITREYVEEYLTDQGTWTGALERCSSKEELEAISKNAEKEVSKRLEEVIHLYYITDASYLLDLMRYGDYVQKGSILLRGEEYMEACPGNLSVRYLVNLQENALGSDTDE